MAPRYTVTITDNKLGKLKTIGSENYDDFKKKSYNGNPYIYEALDSFREETSGKASGHSSK